MGNLAENTIVNSAPTEQNEILTVTTETANTWTVNKDQRYSFSSSSQVWLGMPFIGTGMQVGRYVGLYESFFKRSNSQSISDLSWS